MEFPVSHKASCHCGAVSFTLARSPVDLGSCNCSICRRHGGLFGYFTESEVELHFGENATFTYVQGDKCLRIHTCRTCGCTTHWDGIEGYGNGAEGGDPRMAVNCRLMEPEEVKDIPIRHIDGASW